MDASPTRGAAAILLILLYGSAWGLIEMSLGGFLHLVHFPYKGVVLGGFALALMVSYVSLTRRPGLVPCLGLVAASCKFLDVLLFGVSPLSPAVIDPAAAILSEALAFSVGSVIFLRRGTFKALALRGVPKWK